MTKVKTMICSIQEVKYNVLEDPEDKLTKIMDVICRYNDFDVQDKIIRVRESYIYYHHNLGHNGHLCIYFSDDGSRANVDLFANGVDDKVLNLVYEFLLDALEASPSTSTKIVIEC